MQAIKLLEFEIPGKPEPQLRPRAVRMGKGIRLYDPKTTADYKKFVRLIAKQHAPQKVYTEPLKMDLTIYRQIPKSTSKKRRKDKNEGIIRPAIRPDADNYSKSILDSLNDVIYKDDSQIVELNIKKYYSDNPRAVIEIYEVI